MFCKIVITGKGLKCIKHNEEFNGLPQAKQHTQEVEEWMLK